ncbi:C40 family peptidase [Oerskovia turbata]
MSFTLAVARVGEIRAHIATLQEAAPVKTGARTDASGTSGASATDFASVLAAVGAGDAKSSTDLVSGLISSLTGGAGSSAGTTGTGSAAGLGGLGGGLGGVLSGALSGAGTDDLARLFSSISSSLTSSGALSGAAASSTSTGALAATGAAGSAASVLETAKQYLGVPYVWGGESLAEGGLDCSGLVQLVFGAHGVDLPRVARDQMNAGAEVASLAQAQPGDLIVQRGGKHIGIYLGDGQMIHAPKPGRTVEITSVSDASVTTIRRVL